MAMKWGEGSTAAAVRRVRFRLKLTLRLWSIRYRIRRVWWRFRLKLAITIFKLKRWWAFRRSTPIVYKTRGKRPGSIVVMHNKHKKYAYSIYRVVNWGGTLRRVYP